MEQTTSRRPAWGRVAMGRAAVLALGALLAIAACGPAGPEPSAAIKPIDQQALEAAVAAAAADLLVPGAFVLLRTPLGEHTVSYGATVREGEISPGPDSHFRIGSVTKTMTAAVIMQLAQEGKLRLDDPVSKYRPDVPGGADITVAQLLDMRSGLYNYTADPDFWPVLDGQPTKEWRPEELLEIAFRHPASDSREFDYCNTNTVLLGLIAEQLDGQPLADIYQQRLFAPLGLSETWLPAVDENKLPDPSARGYTYADASYVFLDQAYPPEIQAAARSGALAPEDSTELNPSWAWAAGGVVSTAKDLARWIEALVTGEVLDAEVQKEWAASLLPNDPKQPDGQKYGHGIVQIPFGEHRMFFHNGELPGYNTFAGHDLANNVTVLVWTSLPVAVDGRSPAETLAAAVVGLVYR